MSQLYDAIVIGTQPAGLIAAGLLAKKRRRVLLVDHGETITHYRRLGYRLPFGPMLLPTFESSPITTKVHEALGIGPELRHQTEALRPAFQAVLPGARLEIPSDPGALRDEIRAVYPELDGAVGTFIEGIHALNREATEFLSSQPPLFAHSTFDKLRLNSRQRPHRHWAEPFEAGALLDGIPEKHPLRDVLLGPLAFFQHLSTGRPSKLAGARLLSRYFGGTMTFKDPLFGLEGILLQACERAGVEVRRDTVVSGLRYERGKITAVELAGRHEKIAAEYVISGSLEPPSNLLPRGQSDKLLTEDAKFAIQRGLLTLNLRLPLRAMPKGMGRALFVLNGRRQERSEDEVDAPILLERHPAQTGPRNKKSAIQTDQEVLTVSTPVDIAALRRTPARFRALQKSLVARVSRVVPFIDDYLIDTSYPVEVASWDQDDQVDHGEARIDPWQIHPLYDLEPSLGIAGRPPRTAISNLFRLGTQTFPGLGLEGQYLAALECTRWLSTLAGRKWQEPAR